MLTLNSVSPGQAINTFSSEAFKKVSGIVEAHLGKTFPAITLTVVQKGVVRFNGAWGWIDPWAETRPVQPDTLFDLASVSKVFTFTAFLALASAGRVQLDDPLVTIVPEFGESGPRPLDGGQDPHTGQMLPIPEEAHGQLADPRQVTFFHLLTHTSGLAPWRAIYQSAGPPPPLLDKPDPVGRATRWARALHALCHTPFVGKPGDGTVRYSDLGLMLLGEATSRLYGTPGRLENAITALVFEPLALRSVTFNPLEHGYSRKDIAPTEEDRHWRGRRCWGEVHDENACGVGGIAGHAGLFGTARDVATLGQAWLSGDHRLGISPTLLQAAISEQARTGAMRRGLGWMLKATENAPAGDLFCADAYGHTGFTGTSLWIDPERMLVVACLTNRVYGGREETSIHSFRRAIHDAIVKAVEEL
ncbi:MAG: serine hydrolase domain-containing protein [Aggregatilineaceae bacterium]